MDLHKKFFYENSTDAMLNWIAVFLVLVADLLYLQFHESSTSSLFPLVSFLVGWVMQIVCWFAFDAYGVSVVWCASLGCATYIAVKYYKTFSERKSKMLWAFQKVAVTYGFGLIIYYACTFPVLTTVAHFCSVAVGALCVGFIPHTITLDELEKAGADEQI